MPGSGTAISSGSLFSFSLALSDFKHSLSAIFVRYFWLCCIHTNSLVRKWVKWIPEKLFLTLWTGRWEIRSPGKNNWPSGCDPFYYLTTLLISLPHETLLPSFTGKKHSQFLFCLWNLTLSASEAILHEQHDEHLSWNNLHGIWIIAVGKRHSTIRMLESKKKRRQVSRLLRHDSTLT